LQASKKKLFIVRQHSVFKDRKPSFGIWREEWITKAYSKNRSIIIASKFDHYKKTKRDEKETDHRKYLFSFGYKNNTSFFRLFDQICFGLQVMVWIIIKAPKNAIFLFAYPTQEAVLFGSLACIYRKIPFFVDVRDVVPPNVPKNNIFTFLYNKYANSLNIIIFKICKQVIFMSYGLFKKYRGKVKKPNLIQVIYNPLKASFRFKKEKIKTLTFIGNLNNSFDFSFLKTCPPEFNINIIGDGENLIKIKQELKTQTNIKFFGSISAYEINKICKNTNAFFAFYKSNNFQNHLTNKIAFYIKYNKPIFHNLGRFQMHSKKSIYLGKSIHQKSLFKIIKPFKKFKPFNKKDLKELSFFKFKKAIKTILR